EIPEARLSKLPPGRSPSGTNLDCPHATAGSNDSSASIHMASEEALELHTAAASLLLTVPRRDTPRLLTKAGRILPVGGMRGKEHARDARMCAVTCFTAEHAICRTVRRR